MFEFLHHLFVPSESNNHRAKALHPHLLFFLVIVLLEIAFFSPKIQEQFPEVLGINYSITTNELLELTNQRRLEGGLQPLSLSEKLVQAADLKSKDMFAKNYWAHNAPDGTTPWVFIKSAGYDYIYAGENLARGFTTAADVVNAWMASPGHRENIMSPHYREIGFSIATGSLLGDETVLIVQEFGSQSTATTSVSSATDRISPSAIPTFFAQGLPSPIPTSVLPTVTPLPTLTPSPTPTNIPLVAARTNPPVSEGSTLIQGIQNEPLINRPAFGRFLSLLIGFVFIAIFIVDMIVIERKKIVRLVSHNLDHIMYLSMIVIVILLFKTGVIL